MKQTGAVCAAGTRSVLKSLLAYSTQTPTNPSRNNPPDQKLGQLCDYFSSKYVCRGNFTPFQLFASLQIAYFYICFC